MLALAKLLAVTLLGAGATRELAITLNGVDASALRGQRFENATVVIDDRGAVHIEVKGREGAARPAPAPGTGDGAAASGSGIAAGSSTPAAAAPAAPPELLDPALPTGGAELPSRPAGDLSAQAPAAAPAPAPSPATPGGATQPPGLPTRHYYLVAEQSQPGAAQYDVSVFINSQWIREVRSSEERVSMEVTKFLRAGENRVTLEARKRPSDRRSPPDATLRVLLGEATAQGGEVAIADPLVEMRRTAAETESFTEEYSLVAR